MADRQGRHQHAQHQKGLGAGLVFHVEGHRVAQQPDVLEGDLGNDQQHQQHGGEMLTYGDQHGHHRQLKQIDHAGADPAGPGDAEGHRQALQAQGPVALNALEVVDHGDAQARQGVGQGEDGGGPGQSAEQGLPCPPGQGDVAGAQGVVAQPAVLLELQRRCRIDEAHK